MKATTMGVTKLSGSSLWRKNNNLDYQRWRLILSPADHNDRLQLKLPGAWEPSGSRSPLRIGEEKSSHNFVPQGNKID